MKGGMSVLRLQWGAAAAMSVLLTNMSMAAAGQYQAHYTAILCAVPPCPAWDVVDIETRERFYAVVDFSRIADPPSFNNDMLIEAQRVKLPRPSHDGMYERLHVTAILKVTPSVPGYRP
jgi:hypothetical protein